MGAFVCGAVLVATLLLCLLSREKAPYQRQEALFTDCELKFLRVLDEAAGKRFRVFGKVRMADIIGVAEEIHGKDYRRAFSRIVGKHLDFVLCDPETLAPRCAIELDDSSHERDERRARDQFVDCAMEAAGLPLIHVPVEKSYDVTELRKILASI